MGKVRRIQEQPLLFELLQRVIKVGWDFEQEPRPGGQIHKEDDRKIE